jgi:hypothetical protein
MLPSELFKRTRALLSGRAKKSKVDAALGALRLKEFAELARVLGENSIEVIPLKGMAYGLMFERGGPVRPMADIDLLVREKDFERSGEILKSLGYRQEFPATIARAPGNHERCFVRQGRLVEMHRAFLPGKRITVDYDALWRRALPLEKEGISCLRLDADDTFLYHCFHFGMHEFALGGLKAVWETRRLILEDGPELETCVRRAREWGVARAVWCALRFLEICFPKPARRKIDGSTGSGREKLDGEIFHPSAWRGAFEPAWPVNLLLEKLVVQPSLDLLLSPRLLPRPVQLVRKALIVDNLWNAASYLAWYLRSNLQLLFIKLPR